VIPIVLEVAEDHGWLLVYFCSDVWGVLSRSAGDLAHLATMNGQIAGKSFCMLERGCINIQSPAAGWQFGLSRCMATQSGSPHFTKRALAAQQETLVPCASSRKAKVELTP